MRCELLGELLEIMLLLISQSMDSQCSEAETTQLKVIKAPTAQVLRVGGWKLPHPHCIVHQQQMTPFLPEPHPAQSLAEEGESGRAELRFSSLHNTGRVNLSEMDQSGK